LSIGRFEARDGGDLVIEAGDDGQYSRFLFRDGHLMGAILFGNTEISGGVKQAIEDREDLSGLLKDRPSVADIWHYFSNK